jgi:hypothetical protein
MRGLDPHRARDMKKPAEIVRGLLKFGEIGTYFFASSVRSHQLAPPSGSGRSTMVLIARIL